MLCPRKSNADGEKAGQSKPRMVVSHKAALGSQKLHGRGACQQTGVVPQPTAPDKVASSLRSPLPAPGSCPAPPGRSLWAVYTDVQCVQDCTGFVPGH